MPIIYKHKENNKISPFLWLRFMPNNELEVLTEKLPKTVDLCKIDDIIKKLYPTAVNVPRDRTSK